MHHNQQFHQYIGPNSGLKGKDIDEKVDAALDRLLVEFGKEILKIVPGKVSTEVDARFSFDTQASIDKALHILDVRVYCLPSNTLATVVNLADALPFLALQIHRHWQRAHPYQNCLDIRRHQSRGDSAEQVPGELQPDTDVFPAAGHCGCGGWRLPDLALRWPHHGLVQGG